MPKLRFIFTGLCATAPPGPIAGSRPEPADGPFQVVIPASRPRRAKRSPHYTIPVHLPFIAVRTNDLVNPRDPARRLESCRIKNAAGEEFFVWILAREHVTFETDGESWEPGKIHYTQTNPNPGEIPRGRRGDVTDEADVNWLPDMRRIFPQAAKLRAACLPPGNDPYVAVQMTINSGTLSSFFPENLARSERPTTFEPVKETPVSHVVARQALFVSDLPPAARTFFIRFRAIDTGQKLGELAVELTTGDVTVLAGNTDMDDLLRTIRGEMTETEYDFDSDFELYYDLLQLPAGDAQPAVPAPGPEPSAPPKRSGQAKGSRQPVSSAATGSEPSEGSEPPDGGDQSGEDQPESGPELPIPIPPPQHGGHGECPGLRVSLPGGTP
jgi:hypothetical protein